MQRTVSIKIEVPDGFLDYLKTCAVIFNRHVEWCFDNKSVNKLKAHHGIYHDLRAEFPEIPSAIVQTLRDEACEAVKLLKFKFRPTKTPGSAVRYNARTLTLRGKLLTFSWSGKRIRQLIKIPAYFEKYGKGSCQAGTIRYDKHNKCFKANLSFEFPTPVPVVSNRAVGIDRGLYNIVSLSDGQLYRANKVRSKKRQFMFVKRQLQAKGTKSAKRKLKRRSGKEMRFSLNVNHCISKWIVNMPYDLFVLEDLTGISKQNKGKKLNGWLSNWTFYQLEQFIKYKAEELGKSVVKVDARFTSQKCSVCGDINKSNRNKSRFKCGQCQHEEHADINASKNILANHLFTAEKKVKQAVVNQPNV
jgi:IS605 OrfB family transposase